MLDTRHGKQTLVYSTEVCVPRSFHGDRILIVDKINKLHFVLIEYILNRYHHQNPIGAQMVQRTYLLGKLVWPFSLAWFAYSTYKKRKIVSPIFLTFFHLLQYTPAPQQ